MGFEESYYQLKFNEVDASTIDERVLLQINTLIFFFIILTDKFASFTLKNEQLYLVFQLIVFKLQLCSLDF